MSILVRRRLPFISPLHLLPVQFSHSTASVPRDCLRRTSFDRLSLAHPVVSNIESCAPDLAHFNQIHAQAVASGLCNDAFAASRLIKFLTCKLEPPDIRRAGLLLSQVPHPDVVAYNILLQGLSRSPTPLQSLDLYKDLLCHGLRPNSYSFCFLLASCAHGMALQEGRQVHVHICKLGLDFESHVWTPLLHMYGKCDDLAHAEQLFDEMPLRNSISWTTMIGTYANGGCLLKSLKLFKEMLRAGVEVTNSAAVAALCACAKLGDSVLGKMMHASVAVRGFDLNVTLGTSLVDMYSKIGAMGAATKVFSMMPVVATGTWNSMINGLAMNGDGSAAIDTFREMQRSGLRPNDVTLLAVLSACSHSGLVEPGARYFSLMTSQYGLVPNLKHYGCIIDLHARAGRLQEALNIIRTMPVQPDVVMWGTLLSATRSSPGHALLGEQLGAHLVKILPYDTSGYLILSDAYASTRRWGDVVSVRKMMSEMNMRKDPGYSSIAQ